MAQDVKQLPTKGDFGMRGSWPWDLDAQHALETFLGKTPEQAEEMFRHNFLYYQESLISMGTVAFRFYVLPAIRYLLSESANGDSDAASSFCSMLEQRLRLDPESLAPIVPIVLEAVGQILLSFARFECSPEIYGDVPARYRKVIERLAEVKS